MSNRNGIPVDYEEYSTLREEHSKSIGRVRTGTKHSPETKQKISDSQKGEKHHNYGKSASDETKQKMSDSHLGKKASDETKQKISDSQKGEKNHMYGKTGNQHHSYGAKRDDSTKEKMSKSWENRELIECPYCEIVSKNMANMKRYNFDRCKEIE